MSSIVVASAVHYQQWSRLRHLLWPDLSEQEHLAEILKLPPGGYFVAQDDDLVVLGFVEASLRHDYVNGCETSPVAFLEGLLVVPSHRRTGLARQLCQAVLEWAKSQGCRELASDALLDNVDAQQFHQAIGFEETERVVYFRRAID